ncbi:MAG: adenosylcobinamide amidohydrolase [Candidatus Methanomethylophilaceae archaeon]|jgi:adenosylcobinamide hydrolase
MKYVKSCEILRYDGSDVVVIRLSEKMEILSSAVLSGGTAFTDCIMIMEVPKDYFHDDPVIHASRVRDGLGLPGDTVVFMTAAEVRYVFSTKETVYENVSAFAAVTAGLSNQVVAGDVLTDWEKRHKLSMERSRKLLAGTINVIGVSPYPLTPEAKVNIIIAMTEAKTAAMNIMGYRETGTTSDAIAIVSPRGPDGIKYAGTGTPLGIAMARSVRDCTVSALRARGDFPVAETFSEILSSNGISSEELIDFLSGRSDTENREYISERLDGLEKDAVFVSLFRIAVTADEMYGKGLLKCTEKDGSALKTADILAEDIAKTVSGKTDIYALLQSQDRKINTGSGTGIFLNRALLGLSVGIAAGNGSTAIAKEVKR